MSEPKRELEVLLSQDVSRVREAQGRFWESAVGSLGGSIVLFGVGPLGRSVLAGMRRAGLEPLAFADNREVLAGTRVEGVPVLSPGEAVARYGGSAAFVVAIYNTSAPRRQLADLGASVVVPYAWLFAWKPGAFLPHGCLGPPDPVFEQAEDARRGFELMCGEEMRRIYLAQLRWRLLLDFDRVRVPQTPLLRDSEYFPDDLYAFTGDEVLVDCGAFDGDTVRRFLAKRGEAFRRIYACEPDPANRTRLEAWIATLPPEVSGKIRVEPFAVGARRGVARFDATGTAGSQVGAAGTMDVDIAPIDDILLGVPPTLIKMDVEGAELEALEGARHSIEAHRPVLAICVYHTVDHLWRVPLQIASMAPDYRFFLRAHGEDCWDVTCYAVPKDRLPGI